MFLADMFTFMTSKSYLLFKFSSFGGGSKYQGYNQRFTNMRPGWNQHGAVYHDEAGEAFKTWVAEG